jgi:two-component system, OmpR family, sensor histidine kinase PhoQ
MLGMSWPQARLSLLARLLLGAGLALLLALALVGLAVDRAFQGAAEAAMKERLEAVVYLILTTVEVDSEGEPTVTETLAEPRLNQPGSGLSGGAITPHGSWESPSLYGVTPKPSARVIERGRELFRGTETGGTWNVFAIGLGWEQPDGEIVDLTIWAAEDPNRQAMTLAGFRRDLWQWLGLAAALIIAAQFVILVLLLRPLRQVAHEVREVEAGERDAITGRYPRELMPLTGNLNALLASERNNARRYRQALSDLAHALKTPVAVLRARLESSRHPESTDLAESLVEMEQLIRRQLERAARSTRQTIHKPVAVVPILSRLADSLMRLHAADGLQVDVDGDDSVQVRMDERDLWELCGNLMENAAKYGRGRMRVSASARQTGSRRQGVEILVEDNGPGITDDELPEFLERGRRGDERRDGQGLGLSICRELVEDRGGRMELAESALGGAAIRVILPPR